jgi:Gluconate 2-dehydrogenase subunit 3
MTVATLSRRELLRLAAATAAAAAAGGCTDPESISPSPSPVFFSSEERAAVDALADVVLPPDDQPGGSALGVSSYVEKLLSAFELGVTPPPIHAGGPFSGRAPFGDDAGGASADFPPNDFATFLPMDRVTEASVRLMLYGSAGTPGGGPNDAVLGPLVGLRDLVRGGVGEAMKTAGKPLAALDVAARTTIFNGLDETFRDAFVDLVIEAAWSNPEYGGNPGGAGWAMIHFEGDSQPLGYSLFDLQTGRYVERPDAPMTTPDPGPDPEPMDADTEDLIHAVTVLAGGQVFP